MQKKVIYLPLLIMITLTLFFTGCSRVIVDRDLPFTEDGRYDSEFPYRHGSKKLAEILESVKMINSIAYYVGYTFSENSRINKINEETLDKANHVFYFNETAAGTATIVYNYQDYLALLTCNHIVSFPDTVITFFENSSRIRSVAFLRRQTNYVNGIPDGSDLEVIIKDENHDLALVGRKKESGGYAPVFSYPLGEAKNLEWGSFVYLLGYPKGNKMITRGIVSSPNRNKDDHTFLVDALFNRGFSGGLILAVKDGVPNFELVGIAKSVSADYELVLTPGKSYTRSDLDSYVPYKGDTYVDERSNISYGITNITSIESIQRFLFQNRLFLEESGYDTHYFFSPVMYDN
jgi:hypothetical protein